MKVSNTQTVIICYLTPDEVLHLGGYGTPVKFTMSANTWTIQANKTGDKSVCSGGTTASLEYPGRVNARARSDITQFGATVWPTRMVEGRTLVATVGSMAQPVRETGRFARKIRLQREHDQVQRVKAGQQAALERHRLMETMAMSEPELETPTRKDPPLAVVANGHADRETRKISLAEAIEAVNRHKDRVGKELVLEVRDDGYLYAMVEYGRRREAG